MGYKNREEKQKYQRDWIRNRRKNFFMSKKCIECNSLDDLELHHINRETKISNSIWSWTEEKRLTELSKCVVLCKSCHKKYTKQQFSKSHGTNAMYIHHKCRCNDCRTAHSEYGKASRQKDSNFAP